MNLLQAIERVGGPVFRFILWVKDSAPGRVVALMAGGYVFIKGLLAQLPGLTVQLVNNLEVPAPVVHGYAFLNSFLPLTETTEILIFLSGVWVVAQSVRMILWIVEVVK